METLARIWGFIALSFGGFRRGFERAVTSVFGSSDTRHIKRLESRVAAINALEPRIEALTHAELEEQTARFRRRLRAGETLDDLLVEAFAVCREAGRRYLNMRHYDVQLIGGMVLHSGSIAEMATGEGKTLVATLAAYLNALEGKGVHVVTVNDYLARRDMEWMGPLFIGLGLTVGAVQGNMAVLDRQKAYACDITYGTSNEFGFDYLRDNMRPAARGDDRYPKQLQQSQGRLHYAIVDEVDSILIDEARTPLIISGPAYDDMRKPGKADRIARQLKKGTHFSVNEKDHTVHLTVQGVREAERLAGVESFYTVDNMDWPRLIDNSLKAHHLYQRDVRYLVKEGCVIIIDESTGRLMEGRQWSDGLHQAIEAKEGVRIKEESQTLATITLQNFFNLYDKIAGMTGTGMTEANEFRAIYGLEVVAIPANRPLRRFEYADVIYGTEAEKYNAVADEVERLNRCDVLVMEDRSMRWGTIVEQHENSIDFQPLDGRKKENISLAKVSEIERKGRPILIGTVSIEKSERLSSLLDRRGIKHQVLNAKHHERETEIIAQAGRLGAVTITANMAGRGTDIVLGGDPEAMVWARLQNTYETRLDVPRDEWNGLVAAVRREEKMDEEGEYVRTIGGLHVIGTERHDARRIDLQLNGCCALHGDPGSCRFFLSLEDDLMRIYAGEWVKRILETHGKEEGEAIESRTATRRIEAAQKKVEERHFESRKDLLEFDNVFDEQRKRVYVYRQRILDGASCRELIVESIERQIEHHLKMRLDRHFGAETFTEWAGNRLGANLKASDYRGLSYPQAENHAKGEADRLAKTLIQNMIEENLPRVDDAEEAGKCNWQALAKLTNSRWALNLRDRELKKAGREGVAELILERVREAISRIDLSDGAVFLEEDFGLRSVIQWVRHTFGVELDFDEVQEFEPEELRQLVCDHAEKTYDEKEVVYPVLVGLRKFASDAGQQRLDCEALGAWARKRFQLESNVEEFRHKQREEIRALLIDRSLACQQRANQTLDELNQKIDEVFGPEPDGQTAGTAASGGALASLSTWLEKMLDRDTAVADMEGLERDALQQMLTAAVEDCYRPEIRRMERALILQIVDTAWKCHLETLARLRSSSGQNGDASVSNVECKREGTRLFDSMWESIDERVTDLVFRLEQLDDGLVGNS